MSTITLRLVKGAPLTNQEVDDNFANLNNDKYEAGDSASLQDLTLSGMSGPIAWNATDGALDIPLNSDVTLQTGQEFVFYAKATEAISNGDIVMFAGAQGGHLLIAKADMSATGFDPTWVVGVATQDFAINEYGYTTSLGKVRGLDTSALSEGDILYVDPTTAGAYTTTKPSSPNHIIQIAAVVRSHGTQGAIQVRVSHIADTDEVPEGATNLYFTAARAVAAIKADADWNASDWDTAYSWGNHASAGYLTTHQDISGKANLSGATFTGPVTFTEQGSTFKIDPHTVGVDLYSSGNLAPHYQTTFTLYTGNIGSGTQRLSVDSSGNLSVTGTLSASGYNKSNWDTAYSWGNHASAGYLTSFDITTQTDSKYLRSDTADTTFSRIDFRAGITSQTLDIGYTGDRTIQALSNDLTFGTYGDLHLQHYGGDLHAVHGGGIIYDNGSRVFSDRYHPNADKWTTARSHTVTLTGDVTGSATQSVDGTGNRTWTISTAVGDNSHNHNNYLNKYSELSSGDLNSLSANESGVYFANNAYGSVSNIPYANYFTLLHLRNPYNDVNSASSTNDRAAQLWFGDTAGQAYWRAYQGSTTGWHGWEKLWTSVNDGSGSGLDADLLDGQHASAFASASHSHSNYMPIRWSTPYTVPTTTTWGSYNLGNGTMMQAGGTGKPPGSTHGYWFVGGRRDTAGVMQVYILTTIMEDRVYLLVVTQ